MFLFLNSSGLYSLNSSKTSSIELKTISWISPRLSQPTTKGAILLGTANNLPFKFVSITVITFLTISAECSSFFNSDIFILFSSISFSIFSVSFLSLTSFKSTSTELDSLKKTIKPFMLSANKYFPLVPLFLTISSFASIRIYLSVTPNNSASSGLLTKLSFVFTFNPFRNGNV